MRNPKQEGTNLWDCKSQKGLCPRNCNQCFYNHLGKDNDLVRNTIFPRVEDVGEDGIMRVNSFHDSNLDKKQVIIDSHKYKKRFFNTSIPDFDFPDPVVYTANCSEEEIVNLDFLQDKDLYKLMFIRLRVSSTNLPLIHKATDIILEFCDVPIVWTLMKYYSANDLPDYDVEFYSLKKVLLHERYTPTSWFKEKLQIMINEFKNRRLTLCGTIFSEFCKDCKNCETYYVQTKKRMNVHNL